VDGVVVKIPTALTSRPAGYVGHASERTTFRYRIRRAHLAPAVSFNVGRHNP
jgi:hypothetical protein